MDLLGSLSPLYVFASNYMVTPYVAVLNQSADAPIPPAFQPSPAEVEEVLLSPLQDLLLPHQTTQITVRGTDLKAPYFDLCGKVVWGATACMLSELAFLLEEKA